MYGIFLAIITLLFAALAWRDLRCSLVLLAGLLPTYLLRFSLGPIPSTLLEVLILTCLAVWLTKHHGWRIDIRQFDSWTRAGLLLLAAASFATVVAPDTISAFGIWKAFFVEAFLVYLMMRATFKQEDWYDALLALSLSGMFISLFAVFQFATGMAIPVPWDIERRVTSIFEYPNAVGLFLTPIVTISVIFSRVKHGWERWFWVASIILGFAAIMFAQTEAALVSIPAGLTIALLFSSESKKTKWITAGIGGTLLVIALLIPLSRSKLLLQDYSGQVRLSQWSETVQLLADTPAFGAGLNAYPEALKPYHDGTLYEIFQYPHNIILNIWSELGLLGLIAFFWLAYLSIKTMQPYYRKGVCAPLAVEHMAVFAALIAMTIHGLVDVPYFKNDLSVMTWILIAIMATRFDKKKEAR